MGAVSKERILEWEDALLPTPWGRRSSLQDAAGQVPAAHARGEQVQLLAEQKEVGRSCFCYGARGRRKQGVV